MDFVSFEDADYFEEHDEKDEAVHFPEEIENYIKNFSDYDKDREIAMFYCESSLKEFQIVLSYSTFAKANRIIPNLLLNDDTCFYVTVFDKNEYDYIGLFDFALNKAKCERAPTFLGISIKRIVEHIDDRFQFSLEERQYTDSILKALKDSYSFRNNYEIESFLCTKLVPAINSENQIIHDYTWAHCRRNQEKYRKIFDDEIDALKAENKIAVKWKSEYALYSFVKSYYPDAIFQYRDTWLMKQSLDVFIPSISTAFEYQGIQHYRPVKFFGDAEHFERQKNNDKIKKEKCAQRGVTLIEWRFDEEINYANLVIKMQTDECSVPSRQVFNNAHDNNSHVEKYKSELNIAEDEDATKQLKCALGNINLESAYSAFEKLMNQNDYAAICEGWISALDVFTNRELEGLLSSFIYSTDRANDYVRIVATSEELRNHYLCTHRANYQIRKIILYMIAENVEDEIIIKHIKNIKMQYKKSGETRFDKLISSMYSEAVEIGLDRDTVKSIVKQALNTKTNK